MNQLYKNIAINWVFNFVHFNQRKVTRALILLLSLGLHYNNSFAQTWKTPFENGGIYTTNTFNSVYFTNTTNGWAVGSGGTILTTTNGGTTWTPQISGSTQNLTSVYFISTTNGWVTGGGGTILTTTNGGITWTAQSSGTTQSLRSSYFLNANNGWVVGNNGTILATTNGGATWSIQTSGSTQGLTKVYFANATIGWAVGGGGTILTTTNGGSSWSPQVSGTTNFLTGVQFTSATQGWAVGWNGTILTTSNGGNTWTAQVSNTTSSLNSVYFTNSNRGWASNSNGGISFTNDGGTTWITQSTGTNIGLFGIYFASDTQGWVVGSSGNIFTTNNGGTTWTPQSSGSQVLNSVYFANSTNGWAADYAGGILATTNGGLSWKFQQSGTNNLLSSIYFVNATTGWAVGINGTIRATSNGGNTWTTQISGATEWLYGVYFVNATTGWAVGSQGKILSTTDGGATWSSQVSGTTNTLYSVFFINPNIGWAVGLSGKIVTTTNGGATWATQTSGIAFTLRSVHFTSTTNGWAAGDFGTILVTTNGGATWSEQTSGTFNNLTSVFFTSATTGWVGGRSGTIMYTTNGGVNWTAQTLGSFGDINDIYFNSTAQGVAVDNNGGIFLYSAPPTITSFSPSSGSVGSLVTITGTNLNDPTTINIGGVAAIPISNTGTSLVAMVMPGATTGAVSITTGGLTATASGNYTITASQTPNAQQGNKLVGTGNTGAAQQGYSVSLSADGNTAIVGAPNDNSNKGAAWIYVRNNSGVWSQQGNKLVGIGSNNDARQGWSVSLSADGNTAIVGGPYDNTAQGGAWVYTRSAGVWTQQGTKLLGTGNTGQGYQGYSVSLSADGNTAILGGYGDAGFQGATWVFTRSGGVWTQQGNKLVGTGIVGGAGQGSSVSISADGNTIIVGATNDDGFKGAAWVFTRSGGVWTQQGAKLVGTGTTSGGRHGWSVDLSADGNTAIVGGPNDNNVLGAAWVYTRSGGVWTQQGNKLVGTGNTSATSQGFSVSLSADGNTAIVAGPSDNSGLGSVWVFNRSGSTWTQRGNKLSAGVDLPSRINSVTISADGNTAFFGGPYDNSEVGAAWAYTYMPPAISSATYNGATGILLVTGINLIATAGANNDIDVSKITITGEAGSTYTLTTGNVDITNAASFSITLNSADRAAVSALLNKNGTSSNGGTTYNIAAANDWDIAASGNADLTGNAITVSNATFIARTGSLTAMPTTYGTASAAQNFTVIAGGLTNNLVVTAPAGFEVSTSAATGYGATVNLTPVNGVVATTQIFVRVSATTSTGTYSGNIVISSTGATSQNIATVNSTVTAAALTITANNINKTYGQGLVNIVGSTEFTSTALQNGETIGTVSVTFGTGGSIGSAVGTYTGSVTPSAATGGTFTASNYNITYATGNIIVGTAPLTITASAANKTYGTVANLTQYTTTGLLNTDAISAVTLTSTGSPITAAVNTYPIIASAATGTGLSNYSITYANGTLTVNTAPLTITASAANKTYGTVANLTQYTTTGLLNADAISAVTLTSTGSPVTAAVNTYPIVASAAIGTGLSNYNITYANGTLTVNTAPLTITASAANKTYGTVANLTQYTTTGLLNTDAVSAVTLTSTGSPVTAAVNTYSIVASAAIGTGLSNYSITYANGTLTVNAAPLTITANNQVKCQGTAFSFTGTEFVVTGLLNGNTVSSITLTSTGAATNAASTSSPYSIVPSAAVGTGLTNYSITYNNGSFTVNPSPTLSALTVNNALCVGNTVTLTNTAAGGTWSSTNTSVASINSAGLITAVGQGNTTITYSTNNITGCSGSVSTNVVVWNVPTKPTITRSFGTTLTSSYNGVNIWYNASTQQPISGISTNSYTPTNNSRIQVQGNNQGCIGPLSDEFVYSTSSIGSLYPNPATTFTIANIVSDARQEVVLQLTDMTGKVLREIPVTLGTGQTPVRINTATLARGIYMLVIKGTKVAYQQLVKE